MITRFRQTTFVTLIHEFCSQEKNHQIKQRLLTRKDLDNFPSIPRNVFHFPTRASERIKDENQSLISKLKNCQMKFSTQNLKD